MYMFKYVKLVCERCVEYRTGLCIQLESIIGHFTSAGEHHSEHKLNYSDLKPSVYEQEPLDIDVYHALTSAFYTVLDLS